MQQYSSVVATNAEILHKVQQNRGRILKEKVSITLPLPKLNRNMVDFMKRVIEHHW
jgi:hypothetical protein